jgi:hypothetical protein
MAEAPWGGTLDPALMRDCCVLQEASSMEAIPLQQVRHYVMNCSRETNFARCFSSSGILTRAESLMVDTSFEDARERVLRYSLAHFWPRFSFRMVLPQQH